MFTYLYFPKFLQVDSPVKNYVIHALAPYPHLIYGR